MAPSRAVATKDRIASTLSDTTSLQAGAINRAPTFGGGVRLFFVLLFLFFYIRPLWAAEPSIEAHVDRKSISMDETLTLTVVVKGAGALTTPDIPPQGNFDVVGRSVGNAIEVINGELSATRTFHYTLAPRRPGNYSLGPIKIFIEGEEYSAGPIGVSVADSAAPKTYSPQLGTIPGMPGPPPGFPGQGFPNFPQPLGQAPQPFPGGTPPQDPDTQRQDTFVTVETDRKEAYVGQQILFTFRLYSAVSIQGAQLSLPEFKDFLTEELIKERKYQVELGGRRYLINEWRLALFPTKAGTLETGRTEVKGTVPVRVNSPFGDPFFGGVSVSSRPRTFSGESIQIQIKPLPPAPPNFTGLVGEFAISSKLNQDDLNLGETANLTIEISGKGNIREANLPKLDNLPLLKVYPDQPTVKLEKNIQGLQGKKIFNYALVADRPGTVTIPALDLEFFNPSASSFEKLSTAPLKLAIRGSSTQEKMVVAGSKEREDLAAPNAAGPRDLRPLKPTAALLINQEMGPLESGIAWAFLLGTPGFFLVFLGFKRHQANVLAHSEDRKRSQAFKRAKHAIVHLKPDQGEGIFSGMAVAIKHYLGARFSIKGAALTPNEIEGLLKSRKVRAEIVRRMTYLMEQLDQWKYGGISANLPGEKELKEEILDMLREVEKEL